MVQIANPIYDVVFKYLMNDEKVAKLLLSAIIGEEVLTLDFRPTEYQAKTDKSLTVLRMDFNAKTINKDGEEKLIIIELQKAKLATDIMRFRRYLGKQYANAQNVANYDPKEEEDINRKALPILSIYFLGHSLDHAIAPVIQVKRAYIDAATGEEIKDKEEFIESLTHDSVIIQIRKIQGQRRTELEQLLMIFDQSFTMDDDHFLNINDKELPERYRPVVRRLQSAFADQKVRDTMDAEDDIISELQARERIIAKKEEKLIKANEERDKANEERDRTIESAVLVLAETGVGVKKISSTLLTEEKKVEAILKNRK